MQTRDFLETPSIVAPGNPALMLDLLSRQTNYLESIVYQLRKQNPSVLTQIAVEGTSPTPQGTTLANTIIDTRPHRVYFLLGGKPVTVHSLLIYSTYNQNVSFSVVKHAVDNDGIPFLAGNTLILPISVSEVYIKAAALSNGQLIINGGASSTDGGFFIYGFTVPDFDSMRNDR